MGNGVQAVAINTANVNTDSSNQQNQFNSAVKNAQSDNLDSMANLAVSDPGLNVSQEDKRVASQTLNRMNEIIREAVDYTGAAADGKFSESEVLAIGDYIRNNHAAEWSQLHGDDEDGSETGFHRIQNDGGTYNSNGTDYVDGVVDSIMHLGFEFDGNNFLNEDGDANATLSEMTGYLNQAYFGDFRDGLTVDSPDAGGDGGTGSAGGAEEAGGTEESEGTEKAGEAEEAGGTEEAGGNSGGLSEIMELLQKLLNGEELTDEEKAMLAKGLEKYMKDGELDIEALKADLEEAGIEPEQIEEMVSQAEDFVADAANEELFSKLAGPEGENTNELMDELLNSEEDMLAFVA